MYRTFNLFPIPLWIELFKPSIFIVGFGVQYRYLELSFGWISIGILYNPVW